MGNQQERQQVGLRWLAGLFDGEGHVSLGVQRQRGYVSVKPEIGLSNTHPPTVERVAEILSNHDIGHHIKWTDGTSRKTALGKITIWGHKRCKQFLDVMLGYLLTKKKPAEIMKRYLESRFSRPHKAPYSDEEIDLVVELRDYHGFELAESSETVRQAFEDARAKIAASREDPDGSPRCPETTGERGFNLTCETAYKRGCRCDVCREAISKAQKRRRKKRQSAPA